MSDYTATSRSNAFPVKSVQALKNAVVAHGVAVGDDLHTGSEFVIIASTNEQSQEVATLFCEGPWPSFDPETVADRLDIEFDDKGEPMSALPSAHESLHEIVAEHLVDGAVAIFTEVGFEKMRYLGGVTLAVNSTGETRRVDLDDIYELAKELTDSDTLITLAMS